MTEILKIRPLLLLGRHLDLFPIATINGGLFYFMGTQTTIPKEDAINFLIYAGQKIAKLEQEIGEYKGAIDRLTKTDKTLIDEVIIKLNNDKIHLFQDLDKTNIELMKAEQKLKEESVGDFKIKRPYKKTLVWLKMHEEKSKTTFAAHLRNLPINKIEQK